MTSNANAREFLDYYLGLDGDPEFAVLLEGPWGSGKSHFVETYFRDRFAEARKTDAESKDPLIHVSLFGIRELSDITTQMFEKAHPVLGGKAVKLINSVGSKLGGLVGLSLDPKENAALLESMTLNLKDRILVFDDLERSPLPLVEVMGFINRFVEHYKLKVIVVASEDDITEGQKNEYKGRKEKLVGKTIKVGSDPGEVLDAFTSRLKIPEVLKAVAVNRDRLLTTFAASGRPNFRSLRAVLLDYERIVTLVDPRLSESEDAMGQLLLHMVALGVEFRSNALDDNALRNLQIDIRLRLKSGAGSNNDTDAQKRASDLRMRYKHVAFDDPIIRPDHLADLFSSGTVDVVRVNEHIARHPAIVGYAEVPAWRFMWSWYDHPESDYRAARARFVDDLAKRKITHPGQILHAAGSAIRLKKFGDDLLDGRTVEDYFTEYLADLDTTETLETAPDLFGHAAGSYAGLGYNEADTPEFASIRALVKQAAQRALERTMKASAPILLKRLQDDSEDAQMLHKWGLDNGNYAGVAILHHIVVADFADLVLIDGKPNERLLRALRERHQQSHDSALDLEIPWLEQLRVELMKRAEKLSPPYRKLSEMRLEYWFREHAERFASREA
ncbi:MULTISPECIES: P-loop NTPase fold protein [Hyphobacterium]|uniref:P-loop NTPase fold protein n=1 Tax=Hyphobacterium vulgare TaxID=1736751 RepID=A0ABV6ZVW5_9PROT